MKYVYPAIFYRAIEGGYCIDFPDVAGAATQAETLYEAIEMAEDALSGMLVSWEDEKAGRYSVIDGEEIHMTNRIVEPTPIDEVKPDPVKYASKAFVTLIKADTDAYRKSLEEAQ